MIIIGAGVAGAMARGYFASLHPQVYEAKSSLKSEHKAIMRFRDFSIGYLLGIPLEKISISKGIYYQNKFIEPNPVVCNLYSRKVTQGIYSRSIQSIQPVERFIAKESFNIPDVCFGKTLVKIEPHICYFFDGTRMEYDCCISTIPLPVLLKAAGISANMIQMEAYPIAVTRYEINFPIEIYQTIYFPDPDLAVYRASLERQTLIIESQGEQGICSDEEQIVLRAFGLFREDLGKAEFSIQKMGKIAEINDTIRRRLIFQLTEQFHIYSLGRYAIWKNITADILLKDLQSIGKMIYYDKYQIKLEEVK